MLQEADRSAGSMSFLDHLEELRRRIFWSALSLIGGFLLCWPFAARLFRFLSAPIQQFLTDGEKLAYTRLTEPFFVHLKTAALAGLLVASPFLMLQLWLFVAPGLYRREKRYAIPFVLFSSGFFILGAAFAFKILFPIVCQFFLLVGSDYEMVVTLDQYFSLLFWTIIGVAATFEMPVVTALLARLGVIDAAFLIKYFHIALIGCMVIAALITPPDPLTMVIVATPMVALYGLSIGVARVLQRPPPGD